MTFRMHSLEYYWEYLQWTLTDLCRSQWDYYVYLHFQQPFDPHMQSSGGFLGISIETNQNPSIIYSNWELQALGSQIERAGHWPLRVDASFQLKTAWTITSPKSTVDTHCGKTCFEVCEVRWWRRVHSVVP